MQKLRLLNAFTILLLFAGYALHADEQDAVRLIRRELSISGDLVASRLSGGSDASVFVVTDGSKNYVVKLFQGANGECEIDNSVIASNGGYGPKIYYSNAPEGAMISEYLTGKKVSLQDLESDELYTLLANLLQKIHRGGEFKSSGYDVFKRIHRDLQNNKAKCGDTIPLQNIEQLTSIIHKALQPYQTTAPCHNDLHRGNLIFLGKEFKAIDYGDASPGDPYFDIATIAAAYFTDCTHEKVLLSTYLEREPLPEESAKFYLMKQLVFIKWACDSICSLSAEHIRKYGLTQPPFTHDFSQMSLEEKLEIGWTADRLQVLQVFLNQALKNSKSQEFRDAIQLLNKQKV